MLLGSFSIWSGNDNLEFPQEEGKSEGAQIPITCPSTAYKLVTDVLTLERHISKSHELFVLSPYFGIGSAGMAGIAMLTSIVSITPSSPTPTVHFLLPLEHNPLKNIPYIRPTMLLMGVIGMLTHAYACGKYSDQHARYTITAEEAMAHLRSLHKTPLGEKILSTSGVNIEYRLDLKREEYQRIQLLLHAFITDPSKNLSSSGS